MRTPMRGGRFLANQRHAAMNSAPGVQLAGKAEKPAPRPIRIWAIGRNGVAVEQIATETRAR